MAGTQARKRAPARRPRPAPVVDVEFYEPVRLTSEAPTKEEERVVIAYLDDYELTIPREMPPNVGLKIMRTARKDGDQVAMLEMLECVLGDEGYERLSNWKSLTKDNLLDLFKVVQRVAMGAMEAPKPGSGND